MTMHKDILLKKGNVHTRICGVYDSAKAYKMYVDLIKLGYIDCGDLASDDKILDEVSLEEFPVILHLILNSI